MMQAALDLLLIFALLNFAAFVAGMLLALMTNDWRDN